MNYRGQTGILPNDEYLGDHRASKKGVAQDVESVDALSINTLVMEDSTNNILSPLFPFFLLFSYFMMNAFLGQGKRLSPFSLAFFLIKCNRADKQASKPQAF